MSLVSETVPQSFSNGATHLSNAAFASEAFFGGYGAQGYSSAPAADASSDEDRSSGEFPVYDASLEVPASRPRGARRASRLRGSLLQAIQIGHQIYSALSPLERELIHGRGRKIQSFRKIAESSQIATSTLWRALATYMLYAKHPEIAEYVHLGVGHISVVLSVEEEYRLYFLRNAELGKWSRRKLDDEVKFYHAYRAQRAHTFLELRHSA